VQQKTIPKIAAVVKYIFAECIFAEELAEIAKSRRRNGIDRHL
jgi:hypothetical protein